MALIPGGAAITIAGGIREYARATPSAVAVIDGDRTLSFAALNERASRLANALLGAGLRRGERVGVLLGNRLEYPEIACGITKAGLVMVPLNPRLTADEITFILDHSGCRALILDNGLAGAASAAIADLGIGAVFCIDGDRVPGPRSWRNRSSSRAGLGPGYEAVLERAAARDPAIVVQESEPFCIAYTSGTTGDPKGVVISHRSRSLTFYCSALEWGLANGRTSIAVAPMYHGAGFAFGYAPVYTGGTVVMLRKWDPAELLALVERHRAQSVFLVPTHAHALRELGEMTTSRHDLDSLDTLYFNASALPWPLKEWVMATFPHAGVHELYGSTEAGVVTDLRPADMRRKPGSVGHPWYMTELRVVGSDGAPVAPGEPGELFSRSPFLMNGYHRNPDATAACTTDDGYLSCGDIVTVDEEGYVYVVDRKKDMIVTGGVNVYPREVEDVLRTHPAVADVAVTGVASQRWGEEIAAWFVALPGQQIRPEDLAAHCRQRLAGFKVPRRWHVVDALPRNAAGKVLKRSLRQQASGAGAR
ncbi:class I adenylate-forming enzyme family protein [Saccharopolyspora pogona]|uniref:class I adenylate-forming enzyme family protein n=1 Tax=Saccharopolyspora pogona TaxID=333966 RepID=UPI0016824DD6|nr:AMP-binding protein [Saccharopolyspora pogona]